MQNEVSIRRNCGETTFSCTVIPRRLSFSVFHQPWKLKDREINIYNVELARFFLFVRSFFPPPFDRNFSSGCVFHFFPPRRFCFHSSNTSPCRSSIHPSPSPFVCRFHGNELCWGGGGGGGEAIIKNLMDRVMVVKSNLERCNQNSEYGSQPAVIEGEIAATMTRIAGGSLRADR